MKSKRKKSGFDSRRKRESFLFLIPWMLGAVFMLLSPVMFQLAISFSEITNVRTMTLEFVGLSHYHRAILVDTGVVPYTLQVIGETLLHAPLIVVFSLFIAIILNSNIRFRSFFRAAFFLPVLLGTGFILQQLFDLNLQLEAMDYARQVLLPDQLAMYIGETGINAIDTFFSVITTVFWKSGIQIVLFLAGLQKIPPQLYEASKIDGATQWENLWKITLPIMSPIILLNAVYTFVAFFTDADNAMIELFQQYMFENSGFEYAAAVGWIYCFFSLLLIGIVFLVMRPFVRRVDN